MSGVADVLELLERATYEGEHLSYMAATTKLQEGLQVMDDRLGAAERVVLRDKTVRLVDGLTAFGYPTRVTDVRENLNAKPDFERGRYGYTSYWPEQYIQVSSLLSDVGRMYVLLHEAGHALGRHGERLVPSGKDMRAEVEAESTAWLAGQWLGIDTDEQCLTYLSAGGWGTSLPRWLENGTAEDIARHVERVSRTIVGLAEGRM